MSLTEELRNLNSEKIAQDEKNRNDRDKQEAERLEKIYTDATDNLEEKLKNDAMAGATERTIVYLKQAEAVKPFATCNGETLWLGLENSLQDGRFTFQDMMEQDCFTDLFIRIFKVVKDLGLVPIVQISNNGYDTFISIKVDWK